MPISVQWVDESQTCIAVTYEGHWSWAEFQTAAQTTNDLMSSIEHGVVIIENTLAGGVLPAGNIIANGKNAITSFPENTSLIIVVVNSSLIRTFLSIVANMNPGGRGSIIKTVATLEEAYQLAGLTCPNP